VAGVLGQLEGGYRLVGTLLYGSGMRLLECLTLRVKDVDLERGEILIRRGKGGVDRVTVLPEAVRPSLAAHLGRVRGLHGDDLAVGGGRVALPGALDRKLPHAAAEWPWQWVFPAARTYRDRAMGERRRHHLHPSAMQRAMVVAVRRSGVAKRASCHTCGIALPPISWNPATTSGPSRGCWVSGREHNHGGHPRTQPGRARGPRVRRTS
jgi:integrase